MNTDFGTSSGEHGKTNKFQCHTSLVRSNAVWNIITVEEVFSKFTNGTFMCKEHKFRAKISIYSYRTKCCSFHDESSLKLSEITLGNGARD